MVWSFSVFLASVVTRDEVLEAEREEDVAMALAAVMPLFLSIVMLPLPS